MRNKLAAVALALALAGCAGALNAQTLAQLTPAGISSEGEGCVFMLAGDDAFRTGFSARFNLTRIADLGLQLGLDRACEQSLFGGGADVKLVLLQSRKNLPLSVALDGSVGYLGKHDLNQTIFGFGILASGVIETSPGRAIEPYASFVLLGKMTDGGLASDGEGGSDCPLRADDHETQALGRVGARIPFTADTQLLIEMRISDVVLVGGAINLVF